VVPWHAYPPIIGILLAAHYERYAHAVGKVATAVFVLALATVAAQLAHWLLGNVPLATFHPGYLLPTVAGAFIASIGFSPAHRPPPPVPLTVPAALSQSRSSASLVLHRGATLLRHRGQRLLGASNGAEARRPCWMVDSDLRTANTKVHRTIGGRPVQRSDVHIKASAMPIGPVLRLTRKRSQVQVLYRPP
jgi:hypothetical protein